MKKETAIETATKYAQEYGVSLGQIESVNFKKKLLCVSNCSISFNNDSGKGVVDVAPDYQIKRFEFHPSSNDKDMLPLWIAYPSYNSVTIGWRMGTGELYREKWTTWFLSLPNGTRQTFIEKYPLPEDKELGWEDFYTNLIS
ncbi:MAG: hypothetical protein NE330_11940 [Lentisphaeraceae bacterium]|nr:hypothetical protein [Lentisphaeraceae bacterium]